MHAFLYIDFSSIKPIDSKRSSPPLIPPHHFLLLVNGITSILLSHAEINGKTNKSSFLSITININFLPTNLFSADSKPLGKKQVTKIAPAGKRSAHFLSIMMTRCAAAFIVVAVMQLVGAVRGIGVNWGTQTAQNLHPKTIVQMLKDNNIGQIKLFDSDPWTVKYFAGTGIEVMLGIPNNQLASLADSGRKARDWVKDHVKKNIFDGGVNIKYVAVGNEPFLKSYNGSNLKTVFPALKNIQKALNDEGIGDKIKATIPQNADVYDSGKDGVPSAGDFRSDIRDLMKDIVKFLHDNNAPFLVNIYPFLSLYENPDFPVEFAFFDGGAKPVQDKGISYTNMFDANLDTLVCSLKKTNVKLKIIVGEIGWPTDGHKQANEKMAQKFYDGFLKKMATKKGTPLYPGEIEYYLFGLTDENQKSIAPGNFERHWGIFRYDGQPKFPMDLSGKGNDKMLVGAKDVKYLANKWCVFNTDIKNKDKMAQNLDYACSRSDCTSLEGSGSCSQLDSNDKLSYAFNMYYQINNQDFESCNFDGLAKLTNTNATKNGCLFPIALEISAGKRIEMKMGVGIFVGLLVLLVLLF